MLVRLFLALTLISCATESKKKTLPEILAHKDEAKAQYVTVTFVKGKAELDGSAKKQIEDLFKDSKTAKVRVLAWADKEYPDQNHKKARAPEIILADDRNEEVENFLKKNIRRDLSVESFNMAKRPGILQEMLNTSDYQLKSSFENAGTTGIKLEDGTVSYTKASKAIIIIDQPHTGQEGAL